MSLTHAKNVCFKLFAVNYTLCCNLWHPRGQIWVEWMACCLFLLSIKLVFHKCLYKPRNFTVGIYCMYNLANNWSFIIVCLSVLPKCYQSTTAAEIVPRFF